MALARRHARGEQGVRAVEEDEARPSLRLRGQDAAIGPLQRRARGDDAVRAVIGLGDLVTGSIKRVFDQVGVKAGEIPVVGWGNSLDTTQEVLTGYVNAAQWQDPQATSYVALSLAAMAAGGIPPGFNVITGALYEKDTAAVYDKILSGK